MKRRSRAIGSIYRRAGEKAWTIAYRVAGGRRTERAYADRTASEQLLQDRLRDAAREEVGLVDPYRKHRRSSIANHIGDFVDGITSRNRSAKHVSVTLARLRAAFDGMEVLTLNDVTMPKAEAFLATVLKTSSAKTRDHYASILRQFGAWLLDADRWPRNLLARLPRVAKASDVRRERLALTAEQVLLVVEAAPQRALQGYKEAHPNGPAEVLSRVAAEGRRRGTLYLFSALTGLRKAECAGILWGDLDLTNGIVSPRPATTKNRRDEPLPLIEPLLGRLKEHRDEFALRRGRLPRTSEAAFEVPRHLAELLRKDAEFAQVPVRDDRGRRLDFHALRATFATLVARAGVPLQVGRRLIRHSSPAMTAKHYEKLELDDLRVGAALVGGLLTAAAAANDRPATSSTGKQRQPLADKGKVANSG